MSKELFFEMRAERLAELYEPSFTKKEAVLTGKRMVDNLLEAGDVDPFKVWANIVRLKEVVNGADAEFRNRLEVLGKENISGVEFNHVNGGETLNYEEDEIYCQLKSDLDERIAILKLAQKQTLIDAYGNEVPKVSTTPRKSSITVKF